MTNDEQRKIFGKNLSYYVSLTGKSQKDVAKDLGINYTTFNNWMLGKSMPTMGRVQHIVDYFHIKNIDLINEHDQAPSTPVSDVKRNLLDAVWNLSERDSEMLLYMIQNLLHKE